MLPHTLISTVGTSLLGNLSRADAPEMMRFFEQENWVQVARLLYQKPANDRLCGAEINSIYEINTFAKKSGFCNKKEGLWRTVKVTKPQRRNSSAHARYSTLFGEFAVCSV